MEWPADQLAELKRLCPEAQGYQEAGCVLFVLPRLHLPDGCEPPVVDALLCPTARDGYESRLFFAQRVKSKKELNWNAIGVRIVERNWEAYSWKVSAGLRLAQMVATHLRAFM